MVHYPYAHSIYFTDSLLITLLNKDFFTYFVIRVIGNSAYLVWTGRVTKTGTVVCATNRLRIVLIGTSIPVFVPKNIFYRIKLVVTKNHRLQIPRNPYIRWRIYRHINIAGPPIELLYKRDRQAISGLRFEKSLGVIPTR